MHSLNKSSNTTLHTSRQGHAQHLGHKEPHGMLYNSKVTSAKEKNPSIPFPPLTTEQISSMQCTPKTKNRLFKLYYEFQDPSNGTTFCHYDLIADPYNDHNFAMHMPNPRKHATSDPNYKKVFAPREFKK